MERKYVLCSLMKLHFISKEVNWKPNASILDLSPHQRMTGNCGGETRATSFLLALQTQWIWPKCLNYFIALPGRLIPSCAVPCRWRSSGRVVETGVHVAGGKTPLASDRWGELNTRYLTFDQKKSRNLLGTRSPPPFLSSSSLIFHSCSSTHFF